MGLRKQLSDVSSAGLSSLERLLSSTLKPVTPRREFVDHLGHRIHAESHSPLVKQMINGHVLALVIAGIVSVAALLALLARGLAILLSRKRLA
jgi:hypothetical protein